MSIKARLAQGMPFCMGNDGERTRGILANASSIAKTPKTGISHIASNPRCSNHRWERMGMMGCFPSDRDAAATCSTTWWKPWLEVGFPLSLTEWLASTAHTSAMDKFHKHTTGSRQTKESFNSIKKLDIDHIWYTIWVTDKITCLGMFGEYAITKSGWSSIGYEGFVVCNINIEA